MAVFTYTTGLPNPPNLPSQDVEDMQINTDSINGIVNVDHFGFNDANGGYHRQVTMQNQPAPGVPLGMDGLLYCDNNGGNGWPIWQLASGATLQLAGSAANFTVNTTANGATTLPGGLIVNWGNFPVTVGGVYNIGMNVNFQTSMIYASVSLRAFNGSAKLSIQNNFPEATNTLNVFMSDTAGTPEGIYWMAIGY